MIVDEATGAAVPTINGMTTTKINNVGASTRAMTKNYTPAKDNNPVPAAKKTKENLEGDATASGARAARVATAGRMKKIMKTTRKVVIAKLTGATMRKKNMMRMKVMAAREAATGDRKKTSRIMRTKTGTKMRVTKKMKKQKAISTPTGTKALAARAGDLVA